MIHWYDIALRIVCGVGFGALIGFERQWRARTAGLRTNALVSLGSSLFVIMGAYSFGGDHADPTRVAAQVVSGIGFLGAGVIMKQGATVSGLNTAATLWASAAVGCLCGSGHFGVAAVGAAVVIAANALLRPVGRLVDQRLGVAGREPQETEYTFEVRCDREHEVPIRADVFQAVQRPDFAVQSIGATDMPDGLVVITATVLSPQRDDHRIEEAVAALIRTPEVLGVRWSAEELAAAD